jgi:hypothetical protein
MTEATAILSPNRETQRMLRHRSAVMTLARMPAKKSVLYAPSVPKGWSSPDAHDSKNSPSLCEQVSLSVLN